MSFLKDFKDEISQAVNELVNDEQPQEALATQDASLTGDEDIDEEMLSRLLEENLKELGNDKGEEIFEDDSEEEIEQALSEELEMKRKEKVQRDDRKQSDIQMEQTLTDEEAKKEATKAALRGERPVSEADEPVFDAGEPASDADGIEDEWLMTEEEKVNEQEEFETALVSEDITEVTRGTMIDGNIVSEGSINVQGKIKGNVAARGKLVIAGTIVGSSRAAEIFTNNARIQGDITSDGAIKIGNGSVIIGNVYGNSAVIAGAIQGDIDIQGPVVIDGTAVVQGNIRSRSVQINNGAAIEGSISQCYAEIDYAALFDKTFNQ